MQMAKVSSKKKKIKISKKSVLFNKYIITPMHTLRSCLCALPFVLDTFVIHH